MQKAFYLFWVVFATAILAAVLGVITFIATMALFFDLSNGFTMAAVLTDAFFIAIQSIILGSLTGLIIWIKNAPKTSSIIIGLIMGLIHSVINLLYLAVFINQPKILSIITATILTLICYVAVVVIIARLKERLLIM